MVELTLRAFTEHDQGLLIGGDSEFDDFGPRASRGPLPDARLDDRGALAIEVRGEVAGRVSWHYVQWGPTAASRNPMIGIWLRPDFRGRGIGASAQRRLAGLFFAHTAVNRVEASTDVENIAEQRALEHAGFTREGTIRGAQWRAGAYRDSYLYAILRDDSDQEAR